MNEVNHVYEDQWGAILDRPVDDLLEVRWYDSTADMTAEKFQAWLATIADHLDDGGRHQVLVDSTSFLMPPANLSMEWRDANIIPRYEAAGVRKFAFHMPEGMPAIGSAPAPEGPATFPTGYFGRREDALAWLTA